jgi:hypothetical protein
MHEGCRETFAESVKILEPQASVFLRFPKVEQHPKYMDHAILLGKPFGNCNSRKSREDDFNSSCRIAWSCTAINQSNCVFHCSYYIIYITFIHLRFSYQ